jgi:hypothetical protein
MIPSAIDPYRRGCNFRTIFNRRPFMYISFHNPLKSYSMMGMWKVPSVPFSILKNNKRSDDLLLAAYLYSVDQTVAPISGGGIGYYGSSVYDFLGLKKIRKCRQLIVCKNYGDKDEVRRRSLF